MDHDDSSKRIEISSKITNFIALYPEDKIGASGLYLRGDNCNLAWNKGVAMKKVSANTWSTSLLCP